MIQFILGLISKNNIMSEWTKGCSPSNHTLFHRAIHEKKLQTFWDLKRVNKLEHNLIDIWKDNNKDIVFGSIEKLKRYVNSFVNL